MLKEENTKALTNEDDVIDISMPEIQKKRLRFDGDNNRVAYVNVTDFSVIHRIEEALPKLKQLAVEASEEMINTDDGSTSAGDVLKKIDGKMRELIDYIFDEGVSEAAVPEASATMFDLHNGVFNFERVIDMVSKQYENNINSEYKKLNSRIKSYTTKYTKKKK